MIYYAEGHTTLHQPITELKDIEIYFRNIDELIAQQKAEAETKKADAAKAKQ